MFYLLVVLIIVLMIYLFFNKKTVNYDKAFLDYSNFKEIYEKIEKTNNLYIDKEDEEKWKIIFLKGSNIANEYISLKISRIKKEKKEERNLKKLINQIKHLALEFNKNYSDFNAFIKSTNDNYLKQQIDKYGNQTKNVEGNELDEQQLKAIFSPAKNHLILAGAGSGKTTCIIGYIKYLLLTGVKPENILALSFTNSSASEMAGRVKEETGYSMDISTFHKLGMNIITSVENKKPNIYSKEIRSFIKEQTKEFLKDSKFKKELNYYFFCESDDEVSEFEFNDNEQYEIYLKAHSPKTLKGELVKSYGELQIANFLALNNINYEYETNYKYETADKKHSQYKPDFYLTDYDIYLEYFAVNEFWQVPNWFKEGDQYLIDIEWKRNLHNLHNTKMIECYAYENIQDTLIDNLISKLEKEGVIFDNNHQDFNENINVFQEKMFELFGTLITLLKGNKMTVDDLVALNNKRAKPYKINRMLKLLRKYYDKYQDYLDKNKMIDFSDMINKATEYIKEGKWNSAYTHVIIDEYQDISLPRYQLLQEIRKNKFYKLFAVGDDWQSIYSFAGSDIDYTFDFEKYWGKTNVDKIETTYRFTKSLIKVSSDFITQNPKQYKKELKTNKKPINYFSIEIFDGYTEKYSFMFLLEKLKELPKNSSVLFLGRYSFDVKLLEEIPDFNYYYDIKENVVVVIWNKRKDLKIEYKTIHASKGLQADYVVLFNNKDGNTGFPSKITSNPAIKLLTFNNENFPYAEERRLFYVALTRAKKKVFLLTSKERKSDFIKEIEEKWEYELKKEKYRCPRCGGKLEFKKGPYGNFYGCENYKTTGCKFTVTIKNNKDNIQ